MRVLSFGVHGLYNASRCATGQMRRRQGRSVSAVHHGV